MFQYLNINHTVLLWKYKGSEQSKVLQQHEHVAPLTMVFSKTRHILHLCWGEPFGECCLMAMDSKKNYETVKKLKGVITERFGGLMKLNSDYIVVSQQFPNTRLVLVEVNELKVVHQIEEKWLNEGAMCKLNNKSFIYAF